MNIFKKCLLASLETLPDSNDYSESEIIISVPVP